ncbi:MULTISPECIES: glycogen phosphorylase [Yersinia]|uniref:Alpha-1,4 glucan phosphorylase n=1 Tax=Yersinia rochesterensis TaxID=1604335 RepID=A0A386HIF6_9GAMM|nr:MULTISPECIES: glycogen phosphorylase [Yersinia]AJI87340.1 glycogen/starch/alpha-glucan phosphorylases family protein [Yersinia frederiksenii Y225]CNH58606.1 glycogen phosphorylase [Yersinia kristensenii]AIN19102.1 glycogen/starch/alpha-glucan phosphorylases family protein [Yersinia rochesterensis]AJJ36610.1 glycogen/starch/alpha-glucan phosphorylases family protein [Yersinia rochesterensis]AYD45668.1 glycogen phosphorylase [Yersinia rochesterensis]
MTSPFSYTSPVVSVDALKHSIAYKLMFIVGKDPTIATQHDWLNATLFAVRDRMVERWLRSNRAQLSQDVRQVYYLSMEFLLGRTLSNALLSMGIYEDIEQALDEMGLNLSELLQEENDPGLGNGGLGRLAACFLDSLATLALPGRGYGIRYEYGMFSQKIVNGQQMESPDNWLEYGNAWEFPRHNTRYKVRFGGRIQQEGSKVRWLETEEILACAYDQIIPGFDTDATNTLRLWSAQASNEINLGKFNQGDYFAAVEDKNHSENVSRVLYPDDSTYSGRELRLRQEYFLVSATVQDILSRHWAMHQTFDNLADKIAIHLNDTHPVLSIPEMMRLLIDEHKFSWMDAWDVVQQVFSYTNHTLMSEALETWPIDMIGKILPRHLQIIFDINDHFLKLVQEQYPNEPELLPRVSIINEHDGRRVRMAWLAVIASHKVNGVSALHSELMVQSLFADFARIFPNRFCNKTNGVTPRRWLGLANRPLAAVLDDSIGHNWRTDLSQLSELEKNLDYPSFLQALQKAKLENKKRLAVYIAEKLNIVVNPAALFDVQIKRIHEYKRQLLNVLHVITRYNRILEAPDEKWVPRVVIFAGKAASAYYSAKQIIRLINDVAKVINNDPRINNLLKVVFIPNYSVSLAQLIIPAADLSEQISLAGTEASGTSNMKFALNGALTIGTLDGANVEIREHVGEENIFIFGNTTEQVEALRNSGYNPRKYYDEDPELHLVLTQIATGAFSPEEPQRYTSLFDSLVNLGDHYQLLADYRSYVDTQEQVDTLYRHPDEWTRKTLLNIANMGYFSSDRTIEEYADDIWHIKPIKL